VAKSRFSNCFNYLIDRGLGIGVCTKTLIQTGYSVDVVEIDPKVYEYAKEYFSLPTPNSVYLGDARKFVKDSVEVCSCNVLGRIV
jgi:16S rRNA A1518/A1519 N6-dimethyltransferase RsmA/KsgA/DIM1 with predicted DNA glycosylase/AP lyase activity